MNIDCKKNRKFYNSYTDLCDCDMCKFYYKNIKKYYPNLAKYLYERNIDIQKPLEIGYPYLDDKGNLDYPLVQYIVIGDCKNDFLLSFDDILVTKGKLYPEVDIDESYFIMDIFNVTFDKNIINKEIIKKL